MQFNFLFLNKIRDVLIDSLIRWDIIISICQLSDAIDVEFKTFECVLWNISKVKSDAYHVTLGTVVIFVFVFIDNEVCSVVKVGCEVLKFFSVIWISQDIIRMASNEMIFTVFFQLTINDLL